MRLFSTADLPAPCTNKRDRNGSDRSTQRGGGAAADREGAAAEPDTYDVAEGDGIEEGGGAARRGVVGGVVVGEERRGLAHRPGELRQLLHGLHGRPPRRLRSRRIWRDRGLLLLRRRRPRPTRI
jgi:hypothetical protein